MNFTVSERKDILAEDSQVQLFTWGFTKQINKICFAVSGIFDKLNSI